MMAGLDIGSFADEQLALLETEFDAELNEKATLTSNYSPTVLARNGFALINLHVNSQRTGLGGRTVLDLQVDPAIGSKDLPEHGIRVGDIVGLKEQHSGAIKKKDKAEIDARGIEAVIVKTTREVVSIALNKDDTDVPNGKVWLLKLANEATYKRMKQTMIKLRNSSASSQSNFVSVLFGRGSPTFVTTTIDEVSGPISWINDNLNDSQQEAVRFAMTAGEIALIHGPPGTGKTHTLIELIMQLLRRGLKLLVCGPSNISVDNIVERLAPYKIPMVRLGHPARLLESVLSHSLDILTKNSEAAMLVQDVRKEMDEKQASIRKTRNGRERKTIYGDLRDLRREYRERERGCVDQLVEESKVVLATLHGAGGHQLLNTRFDVVIIDEASQALESQCWIPLLYAKKAILAGDHLQLPPTVKTLRSKARTRRTTGGAAEIVENDDVLANERDKERSPGQIGFERGTQSASTLEFTLFDRLLALHGSVIKRMLTTQYRMHEKIMAFPSAELYESKLLAAGSVKGRLLSDLPDVSATGDTDESLVFYDTQGGDFPEDAEDLDADRRGSGSVADSKSNEMEVALVAEHVGNLVAAGVQPDEIAVITPYNAQLALLSKKLGELFEWSVELGSVDGFQGREKEAVVVTLVRSNPHKEVGFLGEKRRLNVAMTRAKRHLCVIGDSETLSSGGKFLKRWMQHLEETADLRYPDVSSLCR